MSHGGGAPKVRPPKPGSGHCPQCGADGVLVRTCRATGLAYCSDYSCQKAAGVPSRQEGSASVKREVDSAEGEAAAKSGGAKSGRTDEGATLGAAATLQSLGAAVPFSVSDMYNDIKELEASLESMDALIRQLQSQRAQMAGRLKRRREYLFGLSGGPPRAAPASAAVAAGAAAGAVPATAAAPAAATIAATAAATSASTAPAPAGAMESEPAPPAARAAVPAARRTAAPHGNAASRKRKLAAPHPIMAGTNAVSSDEDDPSVVAARARSQADHERQQRERGAESGESDGDGEHSCNACKSVLEGDGHVCQACKKRLHSHIMCSAVWMPAAGQYFCARECVSQYNARLRSCGVTHTTSTDAQGTAVSEWILPVQQRPATLEEF